MYINIFIHIYIYIYIYLYIYTYIYTGAGARGRDRRHPRLSSRPCATLSPTPRFPSSLLLSSLELSDPKVYEPELRARLGTAAHFTPPLRWRAKREHLYVVFPESQVLNCTRLLYTCQLHSTALYSCTRLHYTYQLCSTALYICTRLPYTCQLYATALYNCTRLPYKIVLDRL